MAKIYHYSVKKRPRDKYMIRNIVGKFISKGMAEKLLITSIAVACVYILFNFALMLKWGLFIDALIGFAIMVIGVIPGVVYVALLFFFNEVRKQEQRCH